MTLETSDGKASASDKARRARENAQYAIQSFCRSCDELAQCCKDEYLTANYKEEVEELVGVLQPYRDQADDALQQLLYGKSDAPEEKGEYGSSNKAAVKLFSSMKNK